MKILVVEDEHLIANSIKKGLEQERWVADVAYTGDQGYDLASSEEYNVIILDLMLPGKDGMMICRELRVEGNQTPILMLTARGQIEDKVSGLDAGADDYLTKPFSFEELLARIRALSRRPETVAETVLKVAELTLDPGSFEVFREGKQIRLSKKEFAMLEFLMRHPGKILTKEQIMTHVWDYDADILPNTVEVFMKNLRKKVDGPFGNKLPLLRTVRGFGYMIGEKNV